MLSKIVRWTEFEACGWDEDQGWCDVAPGCVGAQDAEPDQDYDGWDTCSLPQVAGNRHGWAEDSTEV